MGARRVSRRDSSKSSSKRKKISFADFKKKVKKGEFGNATITTRKGGNRTKTETKVKRSKGGKVTTSTREVATRQGEVVQNSNIYFSGFWK